MRPHNTVKEILLEVSYQPSQLRYLRPRGAPTWLRVRGG